MVLPALFMGTTPWSFHKHHWNRSGQTLIGSNTHNKGSVWELHWHGPWRNNIINIIFELHTHPARLMFRKVPHGVEGLRQKDTRCCHFKNRRRWRETSRHQTDFLFRLTPPMGEPAINILLTDSVRLVYISTPATMWEIKELIMFLTQEPTYLEKPQLLRGAGGDRQTSSNFTYQLGSDYNSSVS